MRKDSGFEVTDRINIKYSGSDKISAIFTSNADEIKYQTLADTIEEGSDDNGKDWNINGEKVVISISRV